jgi:hypothetical protein
LLERQAKPWPQNGDLEAAITRNRVTARRMVGCPGDTLMRSDKSEWFNLSHHNTTL